MKSPIVLSVLIFLKIGFCYGQIIPLPNMICLEKSNIDYDYQNNTASRILVSSHYVSEYVESNYQYTQYLNYLSESGLEDKLNSAKPDTGIWNLMDLDSTDKVYLKHHYWTNESFQDYPVLGLNFQQINEYLVWKSLMIHYAYFQMEKLNQSIKFADLDIETIKATGVILGAYRLPTIQEAVSMKEQSGNRKLKNSTNRNNKFQKWLTKNPKYKHLVYKPQKLKSLTLPIHEKLKNLGISTVVETKIANINKGATQRYYELVLDKPAYSPQQKKSKRIFNTKDRKPEEIQSLNFNTGESIPKDVSIKVGKTPCLVFRTNATRLDKKRVR